MALMVLSAGFQTTVQDCGRFGSRKYGVVTVGTLDPYALQVLNTLVGNHQCAAGIEISTGLVRLKFTDERLLAWSGGVCNVSFEQTAVPPLHCARAPAGAVCEISLRRGRTWIALSGGIDVPEVFGSRSTDLRARFGGLCGRALREGDELPLGVPDTMAMRIAGQMNGPIADWAGPQFSPSPAQPSGPDEVTPKHSQQDSSAALTVTLRIVRGKDWTGEIGAKFLTAKFRVGMNSDRMGLRLQGPEIGSADSHELTSEAVAPGTIQLPRDGAPIILLADCQTVGGYPKIAHVITIDLARAAQLQPMDEVRFELTTLEHARQLLRERNREIALFRAGLQARFG